MFVQLGAPSLWCVPALSFILNLYSMRFSTSLLASSLIASSLVAFSYCMAKHAPKHRPQPKRKAAAAKTKAAPPSKNVAKKNKTAPEPVIACVAEVLLSGGESSSHEDEGGKKRVRTQKDRRNNDQCALRALERKLCHIPVEVWQAKRDSKGRTCVEHVVKAQAEVKGKDKKLGTKYWTGFFRDFMLADNCSQDLPDPPEDDAPVDEGLLVALAAASTGNPAGCPSSQLERFLESCPILSKTELYGLFCAIMVSPRMPLSTAMRCQTAALHYVFRTKVFRLKINRVLMGF